MSDLLDDSALERSEIVANCLMNRERGIAGANSYARDLHFDPQKFLQDRLSRQDSIAWLDLCCGTGWALIQAAGHFVEAGVADRVTIQGIDLIPGFLSYPIEWKSLTLNAASLPAWKPEIEYDLVTCVHGLHYVGDKLEAIREATSALKADGLFMAHLDFGNLKNSAGAGHQSAFRRSLIEAGFEYDARRRILKKTGQTNLAPFWRYLGADDTAGPNSTGQPAVDSYYELPVK